jgi:hypothetical protein
MELLDLMELLDDIIEMAADESQETLKPRLCA